MSTKSAQSEKPIPAWVFILGLAICIGGLGLYQFSRQAKRRAGPLISEIQALNQTGLRDREGELTDWIEIWNPTDQPLELEGYFLTDDLKDLKRWRIPKRTLGPKHFLVVFASGKNINGEYGELHTNFRLSPEGEYLAIVAPNGAKIVHQFLPKYEKQHGDISFGIRPEIFTQEKAQLSGRSRDMSYLLLPTPGSPNQIEMLGMVADVKFDVKRGFLSSPTNVVLTVATPVSDIRYTLDGSAPSETNGVVYTEPIAIDRTTVLRASAHRPGFRASKIISHTFVFPEQVVTGLSGDGETPEFERAINGLSEIPSVSLMIPPPADTRSYSEDEAIPVSLEFIDSTTSKTKQVDCGLKHFPTVVGRVEQSQKQDFQLVFDRQFGDAEFKHDLFPPKKPRVFRGLRLTGGNRFSITNRHVEQLISDTWIRSTLLELGQQAARSRFVHLYHNGKYVGVYALTELPEAGYLSMKNRTQDPEFDVREGIDQIAGDAFVWNEMMGGVNGSNFAVLNRKIKMNGFVDFMLVQLFSGVSNLNRDGNWMAIRSRRDGRQLFEFLTTVSQEPMSNWSVDQINFDANPSPARVFQVLRRDQTFRAKFAERARELLLNGGALSSVNSLGRYQELISEIKDARVLETLRWKDEGGNDLEEFLEKRPDEFKKQLESAGLWK